ncbi:hypothetical protein GGI35DRAFT_489991 [Trichoderma velutinum]
MPSEAITLFDLPKHHPLMGWSPNTWKSRIVLNYKGLDYQTEWLGFLDIKGRLENHVAKHPTGFEYTLPVIRDANGTYLMDSLNIAEYLEEKYPEPSIRLDSPKVRYMVDIVNRLIGAVAPNFIIPLTNNVLTNPHREYFVETRSALYGMSLEQVEATKGGQVAYDAEAPLLKELTDMLVENSEGPFILGSEPSYGDFAWVALMVFLQTVDSRVVEALLEHSGNPKVHQDLLRAAEP